MSRTHLKGILPADSRAFCQRNEHRHVRWNALAPLLRVTGTKTPLQPSSLDMVRWCCRSARASCATKTVLKTRFRSFGLFSSVGRGRFASMIRSAAGCTAWPIGSRCGRGRTVPGGGAASGQVWTWMVSRLPNLVYPTRLRAVHEEIARLPELMRQPLVLCLLEGKTQVEAAQEIGCGEATVRRRLARARERLRPTGPARDRLDDSRVARGPAAQVRRDRHPSRPRAGESRLPRLYCAKWHASWN